MSRFPLMSLALCSSLIASLATSQSRQTAKGLESNAATYGLEGGGGNRDAKGTDDFSKGIDPLRDQRGGAGTVGKEPNESDRRAVGTDDFSKGIDPLRDQRGGAGTVGKEPNESDRRAVGTDDFSKGIDPLRDQRGGAGTVGKEPNESDRRAVGTDDFSKGIDPLRDQRGGAGTVGKEPNESDRRAVGTDDFSKGIDPLGHTTKDTDSDKQVFKIFEDGQLAASLRVTAYGQRTAGIDMRENGKLLQLSFRMVAERVGVVQIAGGEPMRPYGLLLGAQRAEQRLPWNDTVLVARLLTVAAGEFDADGKARIQLNMAGVAAIAAADMHVYMQAFALLSRPVTSHGLEFAAAGADQGSDSFGLEGDRQIKDIDALRSHANLRQAFGLDGSSSSKGVGSVGTDAYETYPFDAALALAKSQGKTDEYWLGAWVIVPTSGFELRYDRTIERSGEIQVLFSVVAPAAGDLVAPVIEERSSMVALGSIGGKRVLVFVADRSRDDEREAHYALAKVL